MIYDTIIEKIPIDKGWSPDKKYCAVTADGTKYLLRIASPDRRERMCQQFQRMQLVETLEIPMCRPMEFGTCRDGAYMLESWIDGLDSRDALAQLPSAQQYRYGLDAGRILKRLHSLPAPDDAEPWADRFNRKIDRKIQMYADCPLKYENGEKFLQHIAKTRHLLTNRPQTFQHGDYHTGNLMIHRDGTLTVIDFDRDDYGDPWEEFNRIVWCAQSAPPFANGMVDGYFEGAVPMDFWNLLALYICSNTLGSLPWAIPFGQGEIDIMRRQAAEILQWYDNFSTVIPSWYKKET